MQADHRTDMKTRELHVPSPRIQPIFSSFTTQSRGVGMMFNDNFQYKIHEIIKDQQGNFIIVDLEIEDYRFTLATIYGPNRDDPLFYQNLRQNIRRFENASLIIVGDWNLVMNQELDTRYYARENNIRAKQEVKNIMNGLKLFDIWRINNPCRHRYTWKQKKTCKNGKT